MEGVVDAGAELLEGCKACIQQMHDPSERVGQLATSLLQCRAHDGEKAPRLINTQQRWCPSFCGGVVSSFHFTRHASDIYDRKGLDPKTGTGLASKTIGMMHSWTCLS